MTGLFRIKLDRKVTWSLILNSPVVGEKYIEDHPSNLSIKFNSK
jgi:hypothetical protein